MADAEELTSLYAAALDPETVNRASEELERVCRDPEVVLSHFRVLQDANVGVSIRRYVAVALYRLVVVHFDGFSEEEVGTMETAILCLIQNEEDLQIRYSLCDVAVNLHAGICSAGGEWSGLIEFCIGVLMDNDNDMCFGFFLFRKIFDDIEDDEMKIKIAFGLLDKIAEAVSGENCNQELRIQGFKLFKKLLDCVQNNNGVLLINQAFVKLGELVTQKISESIFQMDEIEIMVIVSTICNLVENNWFVESGLFLRTLDTTVNMVRNDNYPIETRIMLFNIIDCSASLIINVLPEQIPFLVKICIDMSIEMCRLQNDDNMYEFGLSFFSEIADSGLNGILDLFMNFILELIQADRIEEELVGLFILYSIIESSKFAISTKLNQIIQLIFMCNSNMNDVVFSSKCRVISEMIEYMSSDLTPFIDDISNFLIQNISHSDSLLTLDKLFYQCDKAPSSFNEIVCFFSSLIQNSSNIQAQQIISCLSSLFSRLNDFPEKSIIDLFSILNNLLKDRSYLHGKILEFFGFIAKIVPNLIINEIDNLINLGIDSLTLDDDYFSNASIAECFGNLISVFPYSVSFYLEQIVPPLIVILQEEFENLVDFQKDQLILSKSSSMVSLSKFVAYLPKEMEDYAFSPILDFILDEGLDLFCVKACEAIAFSCEGYFKLGFPFDEVLIILFDYLLDTNDKNSISAILMTAGEIFSTYNSNFQTETIDRIIYIIVQLFNDPPDIFLKINSNRLIDDMLISPLFHCINSLINGIGPIFSNYLQSFYPIIETFINDESSFMRNNIILMSSHICFTCQIKNALYKMAVNSSFNGIHHTEQREIKILLGKSIKFLILTNKEEFNTRIDIIVPFAISLYDDYQFYSLICILAISYHRIPFDEKFLIPFIQNLSPPIDSEDISYVAEFIYYISNKSPNLVKDKVLMIGLRLFSSNNRHVNMLSEEAKQFYLNMLSSYTSDEILDLCKSNELNARKIISNFT